MTGLYTGNTTVRGNFGKGGVKGLGGGNGRVPLNAGKGGSTVPESSGVEKGMYMKVE